MIVLDTYRPRADQHPEAAGLYPYTFNANPSNSAERLQTMADLAGFTIYAADFMGQENGEIFGKPALQALQPGQQFAETCRRQADALMDTDFYQDHTVRIGIGDSLGVTSVTGMHAHATTARDLYTALQLRDGFNLRRGQGFAPFAYASFLGYQIGDTAHVMRVGKYDDTFVELSDSSTIAERSGEPISALSNMRNLGPLMQGNESISGTITAAKDIKLPLHVVGLEHGLSGKKKRVAEFFSQLHLARDQAVNESRQINPYSQAADLMTGMLQGWHSDILDPNLGAVHLDLTRQLATKTRTA